MKKKNADGDLTLQQLIPTSVNTIVDGKPVALPVQTEYSNELTMNIVMEQNELPEPRLHVRTPQWATAIKTLCDRHR